MFLPSKIARIVEAYTAKERGREREEASGRELLYGRAICTVYTQPPSPLVRSSVTIVFDSRWDSNPSIKHELILRANV